MPNSRNFIAPSRQNPYTHSKIMNLARLEKLKHIVATCKDLTAAFDYFMDHFGENDEFLDLGKPKPHPFLQQLISTVGGQMFGAKVVVASLLLIKVPGTQFIHGAGRLNRLPVTVIYFDDI